MFSGTLAQSTPETSQAVIEDNSPVVTVRVLFESAFVRSLPAEESEAVGSVFENDILEAIGRNADGLWIEVRRAGREISLGWIARRLVVVSFDMSSLPLTDNQTGVSGEHPIIDTGYAIFILTDATLRAEPLNSAHAIVDIPAQVTIPALERTQDLRWVKVNYLGTIGWISAFNFNSMIDLSGLEIAPETRESIANVEIIPPEVQLAQVYRLRDYVQPHYEMAINVANYWDSLLQGEVRRCEPYSGGFVMIEISPRDIVELPELRGAARLLPRAIDDLNTSIAEMQRCGIYTPVELNRAYAQAINARGIFRATLSQLATIEQMLLPQFGDR
jgi:hypothetical protein